MLQPQRIARRIRIKAVLATRSQACRIQMTDNGGGFPRSKQNETEHFARGHRSIGLEYRGRIALSGGSFRIVTSRLGTTARIILRRKQEHIC